jgi:hypothetical protein
MLCGADVAEHPIKGLKRGVSRVSLTELSELRSVERSQRNARIVIYIATAISLRCKLAASGITGGHARLIGIVMTASAGAPHVLGLGAH